jgi:hypothetical protein
MNHETPPAARETPRAMEARLDSRRSFLRRAVGAGAACLAFPTLASSGSGARAGDRSRVAIDPDMALLADGKKVFPIGFTMPPPPGGKAPDGKDGIAELRDGGATFLRTGVMGGPWDDRAIEEEARWQDAAARNGMYCGLVRALRGPRVQVQAMMSTTVRIGFRGGLRRPGPAAAIAAIAVLASMRSPAADPPERVRSGRYPPGVRLGAGTRGWPARTG